MKNKGHSKIVRCMNCGRCVDKDKAIKRYDMRNMADASSRRDIKESTAYNEKDFYMPKLFVKRHWCVSCGIHARIVRGRSVTDRTVLYSTKI